jgi:hypothetical protein
MLDLTDIEGALLTLMTTTGTENELDEFSESIMKTSITELPKNPFAACKVSMPFKLIDTFKILTSLDRAIAPEIEARGREYPGRKAH